MLSNRVSRRWAVVLGGLAIVGVGVASGGSRPRTVCQVTAMVPVAAAADDVKEDRAADRTAVRKAFDGFVAAFRKGDGKAVAGHWTAEGEYIGDDGTTVRGRAALEKAYGEFFTKHPGHSLEVEVDSIRFPSRDTGVVEGHFKLRKAKSGEFAVSRCSFLLAREDGAWRIAIAREWAGDGLSLRDLEWLIGTWESKRDGSVVSTRYEWSANKSFIRCQFSITQAGKTLDGTQMIGKDPVTGALREWTFEDAGGIGESNLTRDGKKWMFSARGATAEGKVLTATNIITPVDADSFLWQSVERSMDDEPLADLPPVKVVRVKAKP